MPQKGNPVTYGPVGRQSDRELAVNPFWSEKVQEKVRDEATLKSLRSQGLPVVDAAPAPRDSGGPEDGMNAMDVRQLLAIVNQQDNKLKEGEGGFPTNGHTSGRTFHRWNQVGQQLQFKNP